MLGEQQVSQSLKRGSIRPWMEQIWRHWTLEAILCLHRGLCCVGTPILTLHSPKHPFGLSGATGDPWGAQAFSTGPSIDLNPANLFKHWRRHPYHLGNRRIRIGKSTRNGWDFKLIPYARGALQAKWVVGFQVAGGCAQGLARRQ